MSIGGNYNFGVWNPSSGLDTVRYSEQLNFDLACKYNNLQTGKEEGFKQIFGVKSVKFESPDMGLINFLNDNNRKVFTGMTRQGWGGY
ncbi:hypothetical protein [Microcoleus sp. Pol10D4]|uniref:hypothetical protein n=1 Tax=Microcoleus sp. Pol10D4 TaxID=3055387 RepID=UPI002FD1A59F